MVDDDRGDCAETAVEDCGDVLGGKVLGHRGEAGEIAEHDRQHAAFAAEDEASRVPENLLHDLRRDVVAEGSADLAAQDALAQERQRPLGHVEHGDAGQQCQGGQPDVAPLEERHGQDGDGDAHAERGERAARGLPARHEPRRREGRQRHQQQRGRARHLAHDPARHHRLQDTGLDLDAGHEPRRLREERRREHVGLAGPGLRRRLHVEADQHDLAAEQLGGQEVRRGERLIVGHERKDMIGARVPDEAARPGGPRWLP